MAKRMVGICAGVLVLLLILVACGGQSTPAAPAPALLSLTLGADSLVLARNATATLSLTARYSDGRSESVASTSWSSSDASLVRVDAGVVTAIAPGHAIITARYGGQGASIQVTARRNVALSGSVTAKCLADNVAILSALEARIDDDRIARVELGDPSASRALTVAFADRRVDTGQRAFRVSAFRLGFAMVVAPPPATPVIVSPGPTLRLTDADTGEALQVITLPSQETSVTSSGSFSWVLDVPIFDR